MDNRGWSQKPYDGDVTITMTSYDWDALLLTLGYASGSAMKNGDRELLYQQIALLNRLNVGNPNYTPYAIPEKEPA
jgi:hypothetical protein